jgi:hypothetical protein
LIRLTIIPREGKHLYGLLTAKEVELRRKKQGTLHRHGRKKAGAEKWTHEKYAGWINLQNCVGGTVVAVVQSRAPDAEWQLLSSFIGFLDRHFRQEIGTVTISYDQSGD